MAFASSLNTKLGQAVLSALPGGFDARVEGQARAMGNRGQLGLGTIIAAVVLVIAVMLAVIVVDQMDQSLGDPNSSQLSTAQDDVLTGFADMTSLVGPLLIVAISVVVIGLVQRLRG
jgi:hypothetical protein